MIDRCADLTNEMYGGRGVKVCQQWQGVPDGFYQFLKDVGQRPRGKSLDRKNPWGNYEPGNCQWATAKYQANNQRRHLIKNDPARSAALQAEANALEQAWAGVDTPFSDSGFNEGAPAF